MSNFVVQRPIQRMEPSQRDVSAVVTVGVPNAPPMAEVPFHYHVGMNGFEPPAF